MTQVKMFYNPDVGNLEKEIQKWLELGHAYIDEVLSVSQCVHKDPKSTISGVLCTILYRRKQ